MPENRDADATIAQLARSQCGVFSRKQALAAGLTERQVQHRLDSDQWHAALSGCYALSAFPLTWMSWVWIGVLSAGSGATVIAQPAAAIRSWCPRSYPVVVAIPQRRVVHWKSTRIQVIRLDVPVDDVVRIDGLPVTSRLRTAVDIAHLLPIAQAQQLLDRMLVLDVVDLAALTNAIEGSRRHGSRQARRLMGSAADLAASEAERMAQALFRSAGHDWFEPNYPVLVGGRSRKIDLAFPAELLAIEIKGWAFHSLPEHVGSDGDRETDLQLAGWLVVSVSWFDLVSRPEHVVAKVRDALARRAVA